MGLKRKYAERLCYHLIEVTNSKLYKVLNSLNIKKMTDLIKKIGIVLTATALFVGVPAYQTYLTTQELMKPSCEINYDNVNYCKELKGGQNK